MNPNASTDGWTYLEAASQNLGLVIWGSEGTKVGTEKAIGKGKTNTEKIVAELTGSQSIDITTYGAGQCSEYVSGHYDDWFLPSEDELMELMNYLASTLQNSNLYWSSTETSDTGDNQAILYYHGVGYITGDKSGVARIHPVRAF